MARIITKELAIKIRDKLHAVLIPERSSAHDVYGIYYGGQIIATFGIRRGSEKDKGHDHIPRNINVSTGFAKQIGLCNKYLEDYLEYLRQVGLLPELPGSPAVTQLPESTE
jgi:hypothetical protein